MVLMCLRRMENRELHWGFARWTEAANKGTIGKLGKDLGRQKMQQGARIMAFLAKSQDNRAKAMAFRTIKEEVRLDEERSDGRSVATTVYFLAL